MTNSFQFDHSYLTLGDAFFERRDPETAPHPRMIVFNAALAESLGLHGAAAIEADWTAVLSGQKLPPGAHSIAQAYAGHQFGGFTLLGDGRALLLGEHITPNGDRYDVQLKGAGRSRYSRRGDGRATLRAMLREYLISEAIHHLGIPTTRSLAVTATGERISRERMHDGAVLTRIASSHIRVGTFEYVRHALNTDALKALASYTIARHYPEILDVQFPGLALLDAVMERQLDLIVHWMRVGFIHGVMNTDNMSIAGETIDYGPCAFMNIYRPGTVFSSIDANGRYAFVNQPPVAQWNLAVLAGTLLPLIDAEEGLAVEQAQALLNTFPERYQKKWQRMMATKIGLTEHHPDDNTLVTDLLAWMEARQADYTYTFAGLQTDGWLMAQYSKDADLNAWFLRWTTRIQQQEGQMSAARDLMQQVNPRVIPRNHLVEEALDRAESGDLSLFQELLDELSHPYTRPGAMNSLPSVPFGHDDRYQTFCGT